MLKVVQYRTVSVCMQPFEVASQTPKPFLLFLTRNNPWFERYMLQYIHSHVLDSTVQLETQRLICTRGIPYDQFGFTYVPADVYMYIHTYVCRAMTG